MLIVTLPKYTRLDLAERMLAHPLVAGGRYNTGYRSPEDPETTLAPYVRLAERYRKLFAVDLEGRQLRVANWSYPDDGGHVLLNRPVNTDGPGRIHFRHDGWYEFQSVKGNEVFLSRFPRKALGNGQTASIDAPGFSVLNGYLTPNDVAYIRAAVRLGVRKFMLSFVESWSDVDEVEEAIRETIDPSLPWGENDFELILKIESKPGLAFTDGFREATFSRFAENYQGIEDDPGRPVFRYRLMAARDDLGTNLDDDPLALLEATHRILHADERAIVASRLLGGFERDGRASTADVIEVFWYIRYGTMFLLSDGVSERHFDEAIGLWGRIGRTVERDANLDSQKADDVVGQNTPSLEDLEIALDELDQPQSEARPDKGGNPKDG